MNMDYSKIKFSLIITKIKKCTYLFLCDLYDEKLKTNKKGCVGIFNKNKKSKKLKGEP